MSRLEDWFICTGRWGDGNAIWIPLDLQDSFPRRTGKEAQPSVEDLMIYWTDEFFDVGPLEANCFICGKVYDDPRPGYFDGGFLDGTSSIRAWKRGIGHRYYVETRNTKYELGYMNRNYKAILGYITEGLFPMTSVEETFSLFRRMNDRRIPEYLLQMLLGERDLEDSRIKSYLENRHMLKR